MSCKNCYWCQISISDRHQWKCKLHPKKRFNIPILHGWFCRFKNNSISKGAIIKELIDSTPEPTMRIIHEGLFS